MQAKASVASAEANLAKYQADVARDTPLAAQNAIPQKQLDNDLANQCCRQAEVLAETEPAQQNAELNLAWTKVYSPIDGIAGVSNSQIGDLVGTAPRWRRSPRSIPSGRTSTSARALSSEFAPRYTGIITGKVSRDSPASTPGRVHPGQRRALSAQGHDSST